MIRAALSLLVVAAAAAAQDILVIAPGEFAPALDAWRHHREAQGLAVAVQPPADDLPAQVKKVHGESGGKLRFVLLLGDVKRVPCGYVPADTIREWEKDPKVATDNLLADLDGDALPDLAVGRIPADSAEEAAAMLAKVVAHENDADFGTWRRRINVVAGVAGFGDFFDGLIEAGTTLVLREKVPTAYDLHVTWANPASPFCPPPRAITTTVLERLNEGSLFVAYMGHGSPRSLDWLRFGPNIYPIFNEDHVEHLEARHQPIAFLCCCSTGHFDGAPDCLAEFMVKARGGPVAVLAASRVSMPYANGILAKEMLDALFVDKTPTVGEMLQLAKRRLMEPKPGDELRNAIEMLAVGWKADPKDRAAERREHLFLYNLFGDPSMRIYQPGRALLKCAKRAAPGARLAVEGKSDVAGDVRLELVAERTADAPRRANDTDDAFAKCYAGANAWVKARSTTKCDGARFETELTLPADLPPGRYFVRAYVDGEKGAAAGARPLQVTTPEERR